MSDINVIFSDDDIAIMGARHIADKITRGGKLVRGEAKQLAAGFQIRDRQAAEAITRVAALKDRTAPPIGNSTPVECTIDCEAAPQCTVCKLTKPPRGRSVAMEASTGMCNPECPGFFEEPRSGHLWPGELARSKEQ